MIAKSFLKDKMKENLLIRPFMSTFDCYLFTDWPTEAKDPPVDAAGPLLKQEEEQSHRATGMTSNSYKVMVKKKSVPVIWLWHISNN